jgi:hypothetical protein
MSPFVNEISYLALTCFFEPLPLFLERIGARLANGTSTWPMERGTLDVKRIYFPRPQPGGAKPLKVVLWSPATRPDWTALYADSSSGWGHFIAKLSQASVLESVSVRTTLPLERWGIQELEYRIGGTYEPMRLLQWLQEERGYRFFQLGQPLPFERSEPKPKNWVRSRADVFRYISNFGINLEDDRFWESGEDAVYINQVWPQKRAL